MTNTQRINSNADDSYITLNSKTFKRLKNCYQKAVDNKQDKFDFTCEGITHQFVTVYAKYFIQYHEPKFK